jgi:hypothetical protein
MRRTLTFARSWPSGSEQIKSGRVSWPVLSGDQRMRMFFGMILGAFITVGAAFVYDSWTPSPSDTTTGSAAPTAQYRPMVNWDVVGENWRVVRQRAREAWTTLSHKVTS